MTPAPRTITQSDEDLLARVEQGDEAAFEELVLANQGAMAQVARAYVDDEATAEAVVEEAWVDVLTGVDLFDGRRSVRTWILRALIDHASAARHARARMLPRRAAAVSKDPSVSADRFLPPGDGQGGHWGTAPAAPDNLPAAGAVARELAGSLRATIEALETDERVVLTLRDIEGWSAAEVCEALELGEAVQRSLLHRARSRLRAVLEDYLRSGASHGVPGVA